MLSGGWPSKNVVEALYGDGTPMCKLPDLPLDRTDHSMHNFTVCGGTGNDVNKNCQTLDIDGIWRNTHSLKNARLNHLSLTFGDKALLIGGRYRENWKSTELLGKHKLETSFDFPLKYPAE